MSASRPQMRGGGVASEQPAGGTAAEDEVEAVRCPRCESKNTKFSYYNNYNVSQPRHYCKSCRRHWTKGGSLRNIPFGGSSRKNRLKPSKPQYRRDSSSSFSPTPVPVSVTSALYDPTASCAPMTTMQPQPQPPELNHGLAAAASLLGGRIVPPVGFDLPFMLGTPDHARMAASLPVSDAALAAVLPGATFMSNQLGYCGPDTSSLYHLEAGGVGDGSLWGSTGWSFAGMTNGTGPHPGLGFNGIGFGGYSGAAATIYEEEEEEEPNFGFPITPAAGSCPSGCGTWQMGTGLDAAGTVLEHMYGGGGGEDCWFGWPTSTAGF